MSLSMRNNSNNKNNNNSSNENNNENYRHCALTFWNLKFVKRDMSFHHHLVISNTHRLCGLVVRDPGYRSRGPVSIPSATRFSEK
jgi:hypothetical protein